MEGSLTGGLERDNTKVISAITRLALAGLYVLNRYNENGKRKTENGIKLICRTSRRHMKVERINNGDTLK